MNGKINRKQMGLMTKGEIFRFYGGNESACVLFGPKSVSFMRIIHRFTHQLFMQRG